MLLTEILKTILRISLSYGIAQRTPKGVSLTSIDAGLHIVLSLQTLERVLNDTMTFKAIQGMATDTMFPVSVFCGACEKIDEVSRATPLRLNAAKMTVRSTG